MVKQILEFAKQVASLTRDVQQTKTDVAELRQELKEVRQDIAGIQKDVQQTWDAIRTLAFEVQRQRDNEAHEREKLVLRLENALLRSERGIPPGSPGPLGEG
jgi:chromosome segregation ATPase